MANLKELVVGQSLGAFPGGTFNTLVRGELERRQQQDASRGITQPTRSEVPQAFVMLLWDGAAHLDPGSVVVLGEVIQTPENDASVPYSGLQFRCRLATGGDDLDTIPFAITKTPIPVGGIGFGAIPDATWAQVTINDSGHTKADLVSGQSALSSAEDGRVPIIWKPSGTGLKWCVAQLSAAGEPGEPGPAGDTTLFAEFTATATSSHTTDTVTGDIDHSWGGTPASTTGVTVHKLSDHDVTIYSGDKFIGVWDTDSESWKLLYYDGMRVTIKGTIAGETDVTPSTSTFTLSSIALVNGWRLPGSVTVTNDPPIYAAAGASVYARFNLTIGSNSLTSWDTGDGGNFLHQLKGIGGYNEGGSKQYIVNDEGDDDPEWGPGGGISMAIGQAAENVLASTEFDGDNWTVTDGPESPSSTQEIQNPLGISVADNGVIIVAKLGSSWYLVNAACP